MFADLPPAPPAYHACTGEDSLTRFCVWDAKHMGNGKGKSFFVTKSGKIVYVKHKRAHRMLERAGYAD